MTKTDDQLNNEIGQLLFKSSPNGAKRVIARLEFTPEMDACTYLFDYYNSSYFILESQYLRLGLTSNIRDYANWRKYSLLNKQEDAWQVLQEFGLIAS